MIMAYYITVLFLYVSDLNVEAVKYESVLELIKGEGCVLDGKVGHFQSSYVR